MPYNLKQWPSNVYPEEVQEFPEAVPDIDVALEALRVEGPRPQGYKFKPLGKKKGGLWQINLHVKRQQIRILYAPYRQTIIVFHIHKKSSTQEQQRAYDKAMSRKRQAEQTMKDAGNTHVELPTVH